MLSVLGKNDFGACLEDSDVDGTALVLCAEALAMAVSSCQCGCVLHLVAAVVAAYDVDSLYCGEKMIG